MKLPDGWKSYDPFTSVRARPVTCDGCDWEGTEEQTDPIDDLRERVEPGEIMPAGQCPNKVGAHNYKCGSLVHYDDVIVAFRESPNVLDEIVEATSE